jgi:hypothetical protein
MTATPLFARRLLSVVLGIGLATLSGGGGFFLPAAALAATGVDAPNLSPSSDSGIQGDNTTNDASPSFYGSIGETGNVEVWLDGGPTETVPADDSGAYTFTLPSLADGTHLVHVVPTDTVDTLDPSADISLTIETAISAPSAPTLNPASDSGLKGDNITNDVTPTIAGNTGANDRLDVYDDGNLVGNATADGSGAWSFTFGSALTPGEHVLAVTRTDYVAVTSARSPALALTIETSAAAPTGLVLDPASDSGTKGDGITNDATPTIEGSAEPGAEITLQVDGNPAGAGTASGGGTFTITVSPALAAGSHTVTAQATDVAGNESDPSAGLTLVIDTTKPATPDSPTLSPGSDSGTPGDGATNDTTPTFTGTVAVPSGSVSLYFDGSLVGTTLASGSGAYAITPSTPLGAGSYEVTVTVTDAADNVSDPSSAVAIVIDTAVPARPGTAALTPGSDSGTKGDGITNDATPTFTGTAPAGDTVKISLDGGLVDTTSANGSGDWSWTPPSALSEGAHSLTSTATDYVGNESASAPIFSFVINTTAPPTPPAPILNSASDSGLKGDGLTNDTTPSFHGSAEAGSSVTFFDGASPLGTTVADSGGAWSFTAPLLSEGVHHFSVSATDAAGNESDPSSDLAVTIDTTPPSAPSAPTLDPASDSGTKGDLITNDVTPTFSGTAEAGSNVTLFAGSTGLGSTTAAFDGSWTITAIALADGSHAISARTIDASGNASDPSAALTIIIDTAAPARPSAPALDPASDSGTKGDGITNDTTPTLVGSAGAADLTIDLYFNSALVGSSVSDGAGAWSYNFVSPLSDGPYAVTVRATDAAGNVSAASSAFALSIITAAPSAPSAPALDPASDSGTKGDGITNDTTPTLRGFAAAGVIVSLFEGASGLGHTVADSSGDWTFTTVALAEGSHSFTATATDAAGNVSAASSALTLLIDTSAPAKPGTPALDPASDSGTKGDGLTNDATPTVEGVVSGAGLTINLYFNSALVGSSVSDSDGNWSYNFTSPIPDGAYALSVRAIDAAGNISAASSAFALSIITAAPSTPAAPVLDSSSDSGIKGDGITNDATPTLHGSTAPGATVTLFDGVNSLGNTAANSSGVWAFTPSALSEGSHLLSVTVTDAIGNVSPRSDSLSIWIDLAAPARPSAPTLDPTSDSGTKGDGITNDTTPTLHGTAEAGSTVALFDGVGQIADTTANYAGDWTITAPTLTDGDHSFTVTATDVAGNVSDLSSALSLLINTVAPAKPGTPALDPASDSGTKGDGLTNNAMPTLVGTVSAPGLTINLYFNSALVGSSASDSGGAWSYNFTSPIPDGAYALSVRAIDAAGNISVASSTFALSIITSAPSTPSAPILDPASDSGVKGDGITNDATPTLKGTAEAGSSVIFFDGAANLGSTPVNSSGTWTFIPSALAEGSHLFSVTVTDAIGNLSPRSDSLSVWIDFSAPTRPSAPTLDPTSDSGTKGDGITNDATPTLHGTAEAGARVTLFDDASEIASATADYVGNWTVTPPALTEGAHSFTVTAADVAGNVSVTSNALTIIIDTVAPAKPGTPALDPAADSGTIGDGLTNDATPTLVGVVSAPGLTINLYFGAGLVGSSASGSGGTWSYNFVSPIPDGSYAVTVRATDAAGNISALSSAFALSIITSAPATPTVPALDSSSDSGTKGDGITNDATPTLKGSVAPGVTVTLFDGAASLGSTIANPSGAWNFTSNALAEGSHLLSATVTDAIGNVSPRSDTLSIWIDLSAPTKPSAPTLDSISDSGTKGDGITNDATPTLHGTAEAGSTISLFDDAGQIADTTADHAGDWTIISPALADGNHSFTVTATDVAGNVSHPSNALAMVIDTSRPVTPTDTALDLASDSGVPGDGATDDTTPTLVGMAGASGLALDIYFGGALVGSSASDSGGAWSYNFTSPIPDGAYAVTVVTTDAVGNTSHPSSPFVLRIKTSFPITPTIGLAPASDTGILGDGITSNRNPVLLGFGEAGDSYRVGVAATGSSAWNDTAGGSGVIGSGGTFSYTPSGPLSDGTYNVTLSTTDIAGHLSSPTTFSFSIDTLAPIAPTLTLAPASDSGTVGDGLTNMAAPVFTGTAEPGTTLDLYYAATTAAGTTTVGTDGSFSVAVAPALADGSYVFTARAVDAAGNAGIASTAINLKIDTSIPATPAIPVLAAASDSGIAGDGITKTSPITISGSGALAGGSVKLNISDSAGTLATPPASTVTPAADGSWTASISLAAPDAYIFNVVVKNAAGTASAASPNLTIVYATTTAVPTIGIATTSDSGTPSSGITKVTAPVFTGTASPGAKVALAANGTTSGAASSNPPFFLTATGLVADKDGTWTFTPPAGAALSDGTYSIIATATDGAGNVAASPAFALTILSTAPAAPGVPVLAPASTASDGVANSDTPKFIGTSGGPNLKITLYADSNAVGTANTSAAGDWAITTSALANGSYLFTATATDGAGNVSPSSLPASVSITNGAAATPKPSGASADAIRLSAPIIAPGGSLTVSGAGFNPDSPVQVFLHSDPILLAPTKADTAGKVSVLVTIPANTPLGAHEIALIGAGPNGPVTVTIPLQVGTLPATTETVITLPGGIRLPISIPIIFGLLALGLILLTLNLRRRRPLS